MNAARLTLLFACIATILPSLGCNNGGSSGSSGGTFFVEGCSLGCNNGGSGEEVFCEISSTYINQELSILFSAPVDILSVNASSFRVIKVETGTTPEGEFLRDPSNARRLIFRPRLDFDIHGNPEYGFEPQTSYQISVPGENQGDSPPFIRSTAGSNNQSRLQCSILTTQQILDLVPGPPLVATRVDVVQRDGMGNPIGTTSALLPPAPAELTDVSSDSNIVMTFNDVMNVATLADPITGEAPGIRISVDEDGNLSTTGDRVAVEGSYSTVVDQESLQTTLTFTPALGLPSSGSDSANPRKILIDIPDSVVDLAGNSAGAGGTGVVQVFVPEQVLFGPLVLPDANGEQFLDSQFEDATRSGGDWGGGRLARGVGGGSGRLGDLRVKNGQVVRLNTDGQAFPLGTDVPDLIGNRDVNGLYPGQPLYDTNGNGIQGDDGPFVIDNGDFEFNLVQVETGGSLILDGVNPSRIFSKGPVRIFPGGRVDLAGSSPRDHDSTIAAPEAGMTLDSNGLAVPVTQEDVAGGPGAGSGGHGADRYDHTTHVNILSLPAPSNALDFQFSGLGSSTVGRNGFGVGGATGAGEGIGGIQFPTMMPIDVNTDGGSDITYNDTLNPVTGDLGCVSLMVGGAGSGGAYSTPGGAGVASALIDTADAPMGNDNAPANTPGGAPIALAPPDENNTGYTVRTLERKFGFLRGGSGGGGAGNHGFATTANGMLQDPPVPCIDTNSFINQWHDHSGSAGGGGGGALQVTSGKTLTVDGNIIARGGDGASPVTFSSNGPFGIFALPGGGGSGGAIRLQGVIVNLANQAGRLDVAGGLGGEGVWNASHGGNGGTGLVRIEDSADAATRAELAPSITPYDANDSSLSWVSVAAGDWSPLRDRPESFCSSTSCWMRPSGNFFALNFDDDVGVLDPDGQGWNMDVLWSDPPGSPAVVIPFRGVDPTAPPPFNATRSFEFLTGKNQIEYDALAGGGAVVAVRFQGARAVGAINLCGTRLDDPAIVEGSVTPWVEHPRELNTYPIRPNMVRYTVIFDSAASSASYTDVDSLVGVTNLRIDASPD